MIIRRATEADYPAWAAMLGQLHPDQGAAQFERELVDLTDLPEPYVGFLALTDDGEPMGVIDARVRNYAEGAGNAPVAYVEDLWVEPAHRRSGVARALLAAIERWARDRDLRWLGSDTVPDNLASQRWHSAVGFEELERLVVFGKALD